MGIWGLTRRALRPGGRTELTAAASLTSTSLGAPLAWAEWRAVIGPFAFLAMAISLLIYDHHAGHLSEAVFWLGVALVIAVFARMLETIGKNARAIHQFERASVRDELTGLGNRHRLLSDLEAALQPPSDHRILVLVELTGLQAYSNRFGHSQAEGLLRRFGEALDATVAPLDGTAYRLSGSLFAALIPSEGEAVSRVVAAAAASLDRGEEESLTTTSFGEVTLPDDAADPDAALRLAGQRLSTRKQQQVRSARRQAHAVLMAAMDARRPELRTHLRAVVPRAIAVGRRLGLDRNELDDIVLAAALQDVGLLTVPERLLESPEPLSASERTLIRAHPLAGERIVAAAPALASVAALVRSSYERFDGTGYPDGLAGDAIPLGARIIAACVAAAAMSSARPGRPARSLEATISELHSCAGSQFDPRVVEALAQELAAEAAPGAGNMTPPGPVSPV